MFDYTRTSLINDKLPQRPGFVNVSTISIYLGLHTQIAAKLALKLLILIIFKIFSSLTIFKW